MSLFSVNQLTSQTPSPPTLRCPPPGLPDATQSQSTLPSGRSPSACVPAGRTPASPPFPGRCGKISVRGCFCSYCSMPPHPKSLNFTIIISRRITVRIRWPFCSPNSCWAFSSSSTEKSTRGASCSSRPYRFTILAYFTSSKSL